MTSWQTESSRPELIKKGPPIGSYGIQIAAQGVARGLTVVTHNTAEFARVPGIMLEDYFLSLASISFIVLIQTV